MTLSPVPDRAVDRRQVMAAQPARPFRFPPFERHRIEGGPRLIAAPVDRVPLIVLELFNDAGGQHDPPAGAGLASFTAALLDDGSDRRSGPEIASAVEQIGGGLITGASWDIAYGWAEVQSRHRTIGLELLAEVASRPAFPPNEIERLRRHRLTELLRRRDEPGYLADRALMEAIYGDGVYGRSLLGTEESLQALDRPQVRDFFSRRHSLAGATLVAVGDLDPQELFRDAEALFGGGGEAATVEPATRWVVGEARRRIFLVDRPSAQQTELRLGHSAVPRRHPDFLRLRLLMSVLGGKFTSRLNLNLRERLGFTYGVRSQVATRRGPAPFYVATALSTAGVETSIGETVREIERLRQEPIPQDEIEASRQYLVGTYPYRLRSLSGLASHLEEIAVYGLADDYFDTYRDELAAIGPDELLQAAQRHLDPAMASIVAVGPAETLRPQLEPFGEVEVRDPS